MKKASVLLVDDEPVILESVARNLEYNNYSVSKVENGEEALQLLKNNQYDVIITDLRMPGISGIEVLRNAKKIHPETGVFILTGYGDMTSAIEALRLGADDYLIKPCNPDELLLRINRFIKNQHTRRTIQLYEHILPICTYCKKIRDDANVEAGTGDWVSMEQFITDRSSSLISHGCCPECYEKHKDE